MHNSYVVSKALKFSSSEIEVNKEHNPLTLMEKPPHKCILCHM